MEKQDLKVLIVDDDDAVGPAMKKALERAGFTVDLASTPDKAIKTFKLAEYHCAVVDCMLPQTNGIELAQQFRMESGSDLKIIFISGIFRDQIFMRDAVKRVNADDFLVKPFDIADLIKSVETSLESLIDNDGSDVEPLRRLITIKTLRDADKIRIFEQTETIDACLLPLVYAALVQSELSGKLHIETLNANFSARVGFRQGQIHQVEATDKKSFFGVLLVEKGFTSMEEVEEGLAIESDKPIGERLVDINSLSPHAIQVVYREQMAIRLSQAILSDPVKVSFHQEEVPLSQAYIDHHQFTGYLNDWLSSKISLDWLKSYFLPWSGYALAPGLSHDQLPSLRHYGLLHGIENLESFFSGASIEQLLDQSANEEQTYRALHFLLLTRAGMLRSLKTASEDFDLKIRRLKRLRESISGQDYFELLGVSRRASEKQITQAYRELARNLHPDKLSPQAPTELKLLTEEVFSLISQAYDNLKDPERRKSYLKELEIGQAEKALQAENMYLQGQDKLKRGEYKKAVEILKAVFSSKTHPSDTPVYLAWALLKRGASSKNLEQHLENIARLLEKVPPEDRHNVSYFYTKGLYHKTVGNLQKAVRYFRHALELESEFMPARRELLRIKKNRQKKTQSTATSDLTSIFTSIFKKKSS